MILPAHLGIAKGIKPLDSAGITLSVPHAEIKAGSKAPKVTGLYAIPVKPDWWEGDVEFSAHHQIAFTFIVCAAWQPRAYNIVPAAIKQHDAKELQVGEMRVGGFELELPMLGKVPSKHAYHLVAALGPYVSNVLVLRSK